MLSDYCRERKGKGDYLVVHRHNGTNADGTWPARGTAIAGSIGSVQGTSCGSTFLSTCTPVDRCTIPAEWREALDGPDSGLSDSAIRAAAQDLYAVVWEEEWREAGGEFAGGTYIPDECPDVPEAGVEIVRGWVKALDSVSPYPLFDLFTAMGWEDTDEGHGDGLYYLIMGCCEDSSIGWRWDIPDVTEGRVDRASAILGTINTTPLTIDDAPLRDMATEWVKSHPPDVNDPTEIPR